MYKRQRLIFNRQQHWSWGCIGIKWSTQGERNTQVIVYLWSVKKEGFTCDHIKAHSFSIVANKIDDKGAAALGDALMVNTSLRKLHISGKNNWKNGNGNMNVIDVDIRVNRKWYPWWRHGCFEQRTEGKQIIDETLCLQFVHIFCAFLGQNNSLTCIRQGMRQEQKEPKH